MRNITPEIRADIIKQLADDYREELECRPPDGFRAVFLFKHRKHPNMMNIRPEIRDDMIDKMLNDYRDDLDGLDDHDLWQCFVMAAKPAALAAASRALEAGLPSEGLQL
jgi:hypothetical protein